MRVIFHSKTIYNPSTSISKSHIRNQYYTHTYTQKPYINRYALGPAQTNPIHSIHTHIYTYPYFNGVCGRNDVIYDFPFLNFSIIKGKYIYIYTYPYFNGAFGRNDVIYDFPFLNFSIINGNTHLYIPKINCKQQEFIITIYQWDHI